MNFNFRVFLILILSPLFLFCQSNYTDKPDWISNYPISNEYFIGIGFCEKINNDLSYIRIAQNNALTQISSEISISISSNIINIISEKSGIVKEDFKSSVSSFTKSTLKGYELFDKWEDDDEYWVYYRLSKTEYHKSKKMEKEKAKSLSEDMFLKAKDYEIKNDIDSALNFYFKSLEHIMNYFAEPLEITYNGSKKYLLNEIYSSLQNVISDIDLTSINKELYGKFGHPLKEDMIIVASYNKDKVKLPIINLPIKFFFLKGNGKLLEQSKTNSNGLVVAEIFNISSADNRQIVKSELDINSYINKDNSSVILNKLLKSLSIPECEIILNISNISIYIVSNEINFDNSYPISLLDSKIKNEFSKKGFLFSNIKRESDIFINISATSRKGSELFGQYTSFVDLSISVSNSKSDKEIFKKSLSDIKGIGLSYKKAGLNAFDNASKKLVLVIPEIIELFIE